MRHELSSVSSPNAPAPHAWLRLREDPGVPGAAVAAAGYCHRGVDMSTALAAHINRDMGDYMGCLCAGSDWSFLGDYHTEQSRAWSGRVWREYHVDGMSAARGGM